MRNNLIEYDLLCEKCFGNQELVQKLLERFQASLPQSVRQIEFAFQQKHYQKIKEYSHHLKGEAGTMCVNEISQLGAQIFDDADARRNENLAIHIIDLSRMADEFENQVQDYLTVEIHY